MNTPAQFSRYDVWCAITLAAATSIVVLLAITPHPVGLFGDDAAYVVLAKSLAQGDGYRYINLPNDPAGTHFPPLYPLLLAGLWKVGPAFPANIQMFKFANAALLGAACAAAFVFARRKLAMAAPAAAFTAAAACISAPLVGLARMVLSEAAFLALLFPALVLAERSIATPGRRAAFVAGLGGGALGLLRSLGMFLVPAMAFVLLARRRWRDAVVVLLAGALVLAPYQFWSAAQERTAAPIATKYRSYSGWLSDGIREGGVGYAVSVLRDNSTASANLLSSTFAAANAPAPVKAALIVSVLLLLALGTKVLWRSAPVSAAFLVLYVAVILVWPFPPDRFYWGVWPLLAFAFALGIRSVYSSVFMTVRWRRFSFAGAAAALVALYLVPQLAGNRPWIWNIQGAMADRSRAIAEWVRANTAPNELVATEYDAMVYLYSGRETVPIGGLIPRDQAAAEVRLTARESLQSLLQAYPVRWLIPVTTIGYTASADLASDPRAGVAFRTMLPVGAVFERTVLQQASAEQ